jgi:hypothetical protein
MRNFLKIALVLSLSFCPAATLHAQAVDPVRFIVTPETPQPGQEVRIEVQGVGTLVGDATITWRVNGSVVLSGPGERVMTLTAGALGSRATIEATITSAAQGQITREFVIIPSVVNLVWEADTYVPPFFRGKALYTAGSPLKVVAYPSIVISGSQLANNSLSFQWRRNGETVASASGLGRNVFSFYGDQLQAVERIGVDVVVGGVRVGSADITIPTSNPLLVLYNRDPLRGVVYEQAFPASIALAGREITVQAEPYYFANINRNAGQISYEWLLNGQPVSGPDSALGVLTLRQEGGGAGESILSVAAQNNDPESLIQRATNAVQIIFGGEDSSASAGLGAAAATFERIAQSNSRVSPVYTPLEPVLPFSGDLSQPDQFSQYLVTIFRFLLIAGALAAVLMLTIGGITYMVSEVPGVKLDALDRAKAALVGVLILGGSWLILNTINPDLLNFSLILQRTADIQSTNIPPVWNNPFGAEIREKGFSEIVINWEEHQKEESAIRAAIGGCINMSGGCNFSSKQLVYDPSQANNDHVIQAQKDYTKWCETGFYSGTVKKIPGSTIGAGGQQILVCSYF